MTKQTRVPKPVYDIDFPEWAKWCVWCHIQGWYYSEKEPYWHNERWNVALPCKQFFFIANRYDGHPQNSLIKLEI